VPFAGGGEWCGQRAQFSYRLGGPTGRQGRLEYRHEPPAAPTATFSGALPAPPAARAARDPARRIDSAGCGRRPPVRPGRSADLEVRADPVLSAGATRRSYRLHVPTGYRPFWAAAGRVEDGVDDLRFTADLACDLAGRVASVAVVSGALYAEPGECRPSRPVPLLDIHGTDDPVVPTPAGPRPSSGRCPCRRYPPGWPAGPSPRSSGTSSPPTPFRARRPGT
jgi:hypothetical protein